MPRIVHAGHGNWLKGTGKRMQSKKPFQGLALELIVCLGLLTLGFGIRYVGHFVL